MAYDALTLRAVTAELGDLITGSRINRVYQPAPTDIVLLIHKQGKSRKLLLSAHAQRGRIHLTTAGGDNPKSPPMFCMLLRKHLEGGIIRACSEEPLERVLYLSITGEDEVGQPTTRQLVVEIMGKHSNIILINKETRQIIDSIKRIPPALSRVRQVLPGRLYQLPPAQDRINPLTLPPGDLLAALDAGQTGALWKTLLSALAGLSPLLAKEATVRSGLSPETAVETLDPAARQRLAAALTEFYRLIDSNVFTPTSILQTDRSRAIAYAPYDLQLYPPELKQYYPTMNELLDAFYAESGNDDRLEQNRQELLRRLGTELTRCRKKLAIQAEALHQAANAGQLRRLGELILANLSLISRGDTTVEAVDYADPTQKTLAIALNPQLNPVDNAQSYFKRYTKAKNSVEILTTQKAANIAEISYLENCENEVEQAASLTDLEEIRTELTAEGYIKKPPSGHQSASRKAPALSQPYTFTSQDGYTILVGKNSRQNDWLSRSASPEDLWLHARQLPGSHVIIRAKPNAPVSDRARLDGAALAAYYSKGRSSTTVSVDYTLARHVRKPRGAKPGLVIYDHERTLSVVPASAPFAGE